MPADIREYLLDRFTSDAATLRSRAESLKGASKPTAGPNAALSLSMADACDTVALFAQELPEHASVPVIVDALRLLVPKLTLLANSPEAAASPAIRSVYMGACTRVQELIAAESSMASSQSDGTDDSADLEEYPDDGGDNDDIDDDDLYEDDVDKDQT